MLSGWQEILVEMTAAGVAIHRLIQSLFQYRRHKTNAKIKIKRGGTSVDAIRKSVRRANEDNCGFHDGP
jgi:hypothetical protein